MVMEGQNTEKRALEERGNFPLYYTVKVERRGDTVSPGMNGRGEGSNEVGAKGRAVRGKTSPARILLRDKLVGEGKGVH